MHCMGLLTLIIIVGVLTLFLKISSHWWTSVKPVVGAQWQRECCPSLWVNQDHCRILPGLVTVVECDTVYCHYNTESLWVTLYCVTLERVTSECDRVWLSVETWEPQLSVSRGWDFSWTLSNTGLYNQHCINYQVWQEHRILDKRGRRKTIILKDF